MKVSLPVTQQEKPFPAAGYLVSRTDLKGIITYANDAFVDLSGFSRDELIGKNRGFDAIATMESASMAVVAALKRIAVAGETDRSVLCHAA